MPRRRASSVIATSAASGASAPMAMQHPSSMSGANRAASCRTTAPHAPQRRQAPSRRLAVAQQERLPPFEVQEQRQRRPERLLRRRHDAIGADTSRLT